MKRTENNIGQTDHRSVKVHYAPGGASNFSLSWGDQPQPTTSTNTIKTAQKNESNVPLGDGGKQPQNTQQPTKTQPQNSQTTEEVPAKTSVKVHAPPGGKSSITFG